MINLWPLETLSPSGIYNVFSVLISEQLFWFVQLNYIVSTFSINQSKTSETATKMRQEGEGELTMNHKLFIAFLVVFACYLYWDILTGDF